MSSSSNPVKSQYHHFVPRFLLRNFSHKYQPPNELGKGRGRGGKRRGKAGCLSGEDVLNAIDLSKSTAEIVEIPVARSFGETDMYRDFANARNQHDLEQKLGQLESRTGEIVSRFRKNFEAGMQNVVITRPERDTLRKFLFIMKYRNSNFCERWNHPTAESYTANDREFVLSYMQKKGYQKPINVWFDNIKAMLDVKMDLEGKWMKDLRQRAFPLDAEWFILHERMMYLALCTPADRHGEFLFTENSYGIHEGPVRTTTDLLSGETTVKAYTEFHVFGLISPKLIMVLRSSFLPNREEDAIEGVRRQREILNRLSAVPHNDPSDIKSLLEDLPVSKALVQGRGESLRADDKFCFRFFRISTKHVNTINSVILEESYKIGTIVFKSRQAARKALEYYLKNNCEMGAMPTASRLARLRMLEQAVQLLRSDPNVVSEKPDGTPDKLPV